MISLTTLLPRCSIFALTPFTSLFSSSCAEDSSPAPPANVFSNDEGPEAAETESTRAAYTGALDELDKRRLELSQSYRQAVAADDTATMQSSIHDARNLVLKALVQDVFPAWYGTGWDFNGISQTPGEEAIACGYFVTTTLRDVGFDLPRIKLAQQPSQTIINSLTGRESISISAGKPIADIIAGIRASGSGLYIVGLDTHVGFVVNDGNSQAFVHSSYYGPWRAVMSEPCDTKNPLSDSNYRVVGKVLDDTMMKKWLSGGPFTIYGY